ncbi:MAG: malic enzyme-like NAD(P)-binding protein [Clostridia bacterium]|uniref:NAD-dependent malic enzyme n=1 Tax=Mogibacterium kristiansenii TaxID=2606708 RepID=A0A6N7XIU9_9FIRM|nr:MULTISPECIES: malic enzyme-like NAD(P)-binding protein [Mogibacterium]MCI7123434.1 NAD-dependent malic enzyme [Mogibacterium sp.]MDY5449850.1 malic enzyme-like NAD(P)-binding protein [Clostridia bacterium]MEE0369536.1 malic enzyme-like NAD(P)-binding protein [Clostridia bacterium]MST69859.1 NAD-dependent malic enzyme [Mogibacterium kristiansenii]
MDNRTVALQKHSEWRGKLDIALRAPIENDEDLAIAYTPGVAEPCLEIRKDEDLAYEYTGKGNLVAVITDGTAVLGLGDIGPSAAMPVMEGKCALFKRFGNVNAIPLCVDTKDVDEIVETVYRISKSFGGINLEDIGAPRCFEIERKLVEKCDIPIFHDDQHGTAIITCAAILNALKVVGKKRGDLKIVVNGAGAAGIAITELILDLHLGSVILCDSKGIVMEGNPRNNAVKEEIAHRTNPIHQSGTLKDAIHNADVFVGVSQANMVTPEMVRSMDRDPIIFAMANPVPEIMPDVAKEAGAVVVGTGRSDFPNQVNNVLVFPGFFKGLLRVGATKVTQEMKIRAAEALASVITDEELNADYVLPDAFDERVADAIADAVSAEAVASGVCRPIHR